MKKYVVKYTEITYEITRNGNMEKIYKTRRIKANKLKKIVDEATKDGQNGKKNNKSVTYIVLAYDFKRSLISY